MLTDFNFENFMKHSVTYCKIHNLFFRELYRPTRQSSRFLVPFPHRAQFDSFGAGNPLGYSYNFRLFVIIYQLLHRTTFEFYWIL